MWFDDRSKIDYLPIICPICRSKNIYSDGGFGNDIRREFFHGYKCGDCKRLYYKKAKT